MNRTSAAPITRIAALTLKFVRYAMFGSDVTMSASRPRVASVWRIAVWRRLRTWLGACGMNGVEPLLEGVDRLLRAGGPAGGRGRLRRGCGLGGRRGGGRWRRGGWR